MELQDYTISEVLASIQKHIPSWKACQPNDLSFFRLAGLTNKTYRVETTAMDEKSQELVKPQSILLRVFQEDGVFFDREREKVLLVDLFKNGIGPELYGAEEKFRFEEFYRDSRSLKSSEMNLPHILGTIARTMAKFHSIKPDCVPKTPLIEAIFEGGELRKAFYEKIEMELSRGSFSEDEGLILRDVESLLSPSESEFLMRIAPNMGELVFSHNDLLPGNILVIQESELVFIDYEYGSYNYRGFDIANYWNEALIDYSVPKAPYFMVVEDSFTLEDADDLIFNYVVYHNANKITLEDGTLLSEQFKKERLIGLELKNKLKELPLVQMECQTLWEEVKVCKLMSHAYWIIWAVVMCKKAEVNFDYLKFAHERLKQYWKLKEMWFPAKEEKKMETKMEVEVDFQMKLTA